ncbi:MAG: hypothetical protein ACPGOY_15890 [Rhodospirillaceae bacterium]
MSDLRAPVPSEQNRRTTRPPMASLRLEDNREIKLPGPWLHLLQGVEGDSWGSALLQGGEAARDQQNANRRLAEVERPK